MVAAGRTGSSASKLLAAALCIIGVGLAGPAAAQPNCAQEAAAIRRAENQLPKLEIAPPDDKQIVCITLETNVLFARRFTAHVSQCPRSPLAGGAGNWQRIGAQYSGYFANRGCKPTIKGFRG